MLQQESNFWALKNYFTLPGFTGIDTGAVSIKPK